MSVDVENLVGKIDDYFAYHLDYEYWQNLDNEIKKQAVMMSLNDISSHVGSTQNDIISNQYGINAIAEQAVYLSRNYGSMTSNKIVTSEGLDGISQSFSIVGESIAISHRADKYIMQLKKFLRPSTIRISRG